MLGKSQLKAIIQPMSWKTDDNLIIFHISTNLIQS